MMITAPHPLAAPSRSGARRANALPSGHLLDEYRIEAILGAGGFGVTYKALDTHLETWVAIKEYFPVEWSFRDHDGVTVHSNTQGQTSTVEGQESDYRWGLERFLDEARVLARIQHPHVVRVKRYFRAHGTAYIVMDYEEGESLSAILRDDEIFDEEQIRGLLEDVLPALQAVHDQGYLHRDIKPANLYLRSTDHRVMLIDFGAARAALGYHSKSVTSLVTPGYSPPEQYTTRNDRYGSWTDIYALGAVLYRCVTGHAPTEAAERLLDDQMEPAIQAGAGRYSTNLLRAIDRALAVRPEHRFRTVSEMQTALAGSEYGDETVILAPLFAKPGAPTRETGPSPPTGRPVVPRAGPGTGAGSVEVAQSSVRHPRPADLRRAAVPHPEPVESSRRRPPMGLLVGGVGVAALAAMMVWFWPATPVREPTLPPRSTLNPPELVERTVDGEPVAPDSSGASVSRLAPPGTTVDASPVEPSVAMEPLTAPAPGIESGAPIAFPEAPAPGMAGPEADFVVTEPDALEQEPAAVDVESGSSPEVDEVTAQPLPGQSRQDEAAMAESPSAPLTAGAVGGPPPAAARSGATARSSATRKPPPRQTTTTKRSRLRQADRRKTEPRPTVVTPPERQEKPGARASRNPWQPPTDTGFNQK
jgi:serine/threonine protein kinase